MTRKGTSCLFKIGFPTTPPEHRSVEGKKITFKDNSEYLGPPPKEFPLPAPPQDADENDLPSNEYYKIGLSALEGSISSVEEKVVEVIANPDLSPSSVKKLARELGRDQKYLKSIKLKVIDFEANEAAEEAMEQGVADAI